MDTPLSAPREHIPAASADSALSNPAQSDPIAQEALRMVTEIPKDTAAYAAYQLRMTEACLRVQHAIESGVPLDDAIAAAPKDIQGWLKRHAFGAHAQAPDSAAAAGSSLPESADENEKFEQLYPGIIQSLGLKNSSPESLAKRQALMEEVMKLTEAGMPKSRALSYAADRLAGTAIPGKPTVEPLASAVLPSSLPPTHARNEPQEVTLDNIDSLTLQDLERIKKLRREGK